MGRRSEDAQAARPRLAAEQLVEAGKALADCLGDHVDSGWMRFETLGANTDHCFKTGGRPPDHALRTGVEAGACAVAGELDRGAEPGSDRR